MFVNKDLNQSSYLSKFINGNVGLHGPMALDRRHVRDRLTDVGVPRLDLISVHSSIDIPWTKGAIDMDMRSTSGTISEDSLDSIHDIKHHDDIHHRGLFTTLPVVPHDDLLINHSLYDSGRPHNDHQRASRRFSDISLPSQYRMKAAPESDAAFAKIKTKKTPLCFEPRKAVQNVSKTGTNFKVRRQAAFNPPPPTPNVLADAPYRRQPTLYDQRLLQSRTQTVSTTRMPLLPPLTTSADISEGYSASMRRREALYAQFTMRDSKRHASGSTETQIRSPAAPSSSAASAKRDLMISYSRTVREKQMKKQPPSKGSCTECPPSLPSKRIPNEIFYNDDLERMLQRHEDDKRIAAQIRQRWEKIQ